MINFNLQKQSLDKHSKEFMHFIHAWAKFESSCLATYGSWYNKLHTQETNKLILWGFDTNVAIFPLNYTLDVIAIFDIYLV